MFHRSGQQDNISKERSNIQIGDEINYNTPSSHPGRRHKTGLKTTYSKVLVGPRGEEVLR